MAEVGPWKPGRLCPRDWRGLDPHPYFAVGSWRRGASASSAVQGFLGSRLPVKLRLLPGDVNRASELERGTERRALALKALPCYLRCLGYALFVVIRWGSFMSRGLIVAGLVLTTSVPWAAAEPKEHDRRKVDAEVRDVLSVIGPLMEALGSHRGPDRGRPAAPDRGAAQRQYRHRGLGLDRALGPLREGREGRRRPHGGAARRSPSRHRRRRRALEPRRRRR